MILEADDQAAQKKLASQFVAQLRGQNHRLVGGMTGSGAYWLLIRGAVYIEIRIKKAVAAAK